MYTHSTTSSIPTSTIFLGKIVQFLIGQIELRHLAPAFDSGRLCCHPGLQAFARAGLVLVAAIALPDIAELGREIGALAQDRVAVDAGVLLPDMLAARHGVRQRLLVRRGRADVVASLNTGSSP